MFEKGVGWCGCETTQPVPQWDRWRIRSDLCCWSCFKTASLTLSTFRGLNIPKKTLKTRWPKVRCKQMQKGGWDTPTHPVLRDMDGHWSLKDLEANEHLKKTMYYNQHIYIFLILVFLKHPSLQEIERKRSLLFLRLVRYNMFMWFMHFYLQREQYW